MMSSLRDGWRQEPPRRKALYLIGAAVLVMLTIASIVGWVFFTNGSSVNATVEKPAVVKDTDAATSESEGEAAPSTVTVGEYTFELDDNGMAIMPVTTDPAEAAAGAAAVAWNVDTTKLSRQEFFDIAIERMTNPSEKYRGPNGEIHTLFTNYAFQEPERERGEPSVYMHDEVKLCGLTEHLVRPCLWWVLANYDTYENQQRMEAVWSGTPALIMSEDEMSEWNKETLGYPIQEDVDLTPDTPGASLTRLFVMSDVERFYGAGAADFNTENERLGAAFRIWCDAPEDGGLCGVASFGRAGVMPSVWPN